MAIIYANYEISILMKCLFIYYGILVELIIDISLQNTFIYFKMLLTVMLKYIFFRGRERVGQLTINMKEVEKCSEVNV